MCERLRAFFVIFFTFLPQLATFTTTISHRANRTPSQFPAALLLQHLARTDSIACQINIIFMEHPLHPPSLVFLSLPKYISPLPSIIRRSPSLIFFVELVLDAPHVRVNIPECSFFAYDLF